MTPMARERNDRYRDLFDDGAEGRCPPLTPAAVKAAEAALGYRLPKAYLDVLAVCNGGWLKRSEFPTAAGTVSFNPLMGVGGEDGIDAELGSRYLIAEWGYPDIGVVISGDGHTAFMLDYSECGPQGEPRVVWVDTGTDGGREQVVVLAPDFATFVDQLREDE